MSDCIERCKTVEKILQYLNREKVCATYKAVGEVIGVPPQGVSYFLGERRPAASWVVNAKTKQPTGYSEKEKHDEWDNSQKPIKTGDKLRKL